MYEVRKKERKDKYMKDGRKDKRDRMRKKKKGGKKD